MVFPPGEHRIFVRTVERGRAVPGGAELRTHFQQFGEVVDVYRPGRTPDVAYITMGSDEELQMALVDPSPVVCEVALTLQQAVPRSASPPAGGAANGGWAAGVGAPAGAVQGAGTYNAASAAFAAAATAAAAPSARVYVQGLAEDVGEDMLLMHFSMFGTVKDIYVPVDRTTGLKRPFAFVTMSSPEEAAAILSMPSHALGADKVVNVSLAEPRDTRAGPGGSPGGFAAPAGYLRPAAALAHGKGAPNWEQGGGRPLLRVVQAEDAPKQGVPGVWRLFVFGMPPGLNADMLRGHFARHGEILDIYVPPKNPELAYITFSTEEELKDALANSGIRIAGFTVQGLKLAEPREPRGGGGGGGGGGGYGPWGKAKGKGEQRGPYW